MKKEYIFLLLYLVCFTSFLQGTYQLINHPGRYTLGTDIIFTPTSLNDFAIIINASNVELDLGHHTIYQNANNFLADTGGIKVNANLFNTYIHDGYISNMTGTGIVINEGCTRIIIENIETFSCDVCGLDCFGTTLNPIENVSIDNCLTFSCCSTAVDFIASAFRMSHCKHSEITNCVASGTKNMITNIAGFYLQDCEHCTFINNKAQCSVGSFSSAGFAISNGSDNIFTDCYALGNTITTFFPLNFVYGFVLFSLNNAIIRRTTFNNCVAFQNNGAMFALGFGVQGAFEDINFIDCQSLSNTATTVSAGFFCTDAFHINFINCLAKGNSTSLLPSTTAAGFFLLNGTNVSIINCLADNQRGESSFGYIIERCFDCQIQMSKALVNSGSVNSFSYGFAVNPLIGTPDTGNNHFIQNLATDNGLEMNNQMNNFQAGTFFNVHYASLNSVTSPYTNLGIVP